MATITPRNTKAGKTRFTAQIRIKKDGKLVHSESETFERKATAKAWATKREAELRAPDGLRKPSVRDETVGDAITLYLEHHKAIGKTKAQVLRTLATYDIADIRCEELTKGDVTALINDLGQPNEKGETRKPQTVANYLSHLQAVFRSAIDAHDWPLSMDTISGPVRNATKQGLISKSGKRERRPTLSEMDSLLDHFEAVRANYPRSNPMAKIAAFAMFSTRRQEEITRITWADLDEAGSRVLVRDMKNPGQKIGNDVWCDLPPEALAIIQSMPRTGARIFPYGTDAISAAFTRACKFLGIKDLHFHDLRHEGVSRLFEMGRTIPQVAPVSGHRSWQSLQRYAQVRADGDKWADWPWMERLTV